MRYYIIRSFSICLLVLTPLHAEDFPPQDHAGADLRVADDDRIWGVHTNVGQFLSVSSQSPVLVRKFETSVPGSGFVEIHGDTILILGTLDANGAGHEGSGGGGGGGVKDVTAGNGSNFPGGAGGVAFRDGNPGLAGESGSSNQNGGGGAGGAAAGPWAGAGGLGGIPGVDGPDGANGGYLALAANGDTSIDTSAQLGSGGGGGGGAGGDGRPGISNFPVGGGGGGGGGGAGGGSVRLFASSNVTLTNATILTRGTLGERGGEGSRVFGAAGGDTLPEETGRGRGTFFAFRGGRGGAGAGGGIVIFCDTPGGITLNGATLDARSGRNELSNSGTIKVFFDGEDPRQFATIQAGRIYYPGVERFNNHDFILGLPEIPPLIGNTRDVNSDSDIDIADIISQLP